MSVNAFDVHVAKGFDFCPSIEHFSFNDHEASEQCCKSEEIKREVLALHSRISILFKNLKAPPLAQKKSIHKKNQKKLKLEICELLKNKEIKNDSPAVACMDENANILNSVTACIQSVDSVKVFTGNRKPSFPSAEDIRIEPDTIDPIQSGKID